MSFTDMNKAELLSVAEAFSVDAEGLSLAKLKSEILNDGITWEMWQSHKGLIDNAKESEDIDTEAREQSSVGILPDAKEAFRSAKINKYILKMDRENGTYEVRGYKFTKQHPYVIVEESDATWILQNQQGFRMATPLEAQNYYK